MKEAESKCCGSFIVRDRCYSRHFHTTVFILLIKTSFEWGLN
jgi:hypothetical protein